MALQDELNLTLESADFSCDQLKVSKVSGKEAVGRLFELDVELVFLAAHDGPAAEDMAGARATLVFERPAGPGVGWHGVRKIHGLIAEVDDLCSTHADYRVYRIRLVPRAFALTLVEMQDIFMNLSVPEIIRGKAGAVGLASELEMRLARDYPTREFVVQYHESDLAFVSRLAEHLGVSFHFEHGDTASKLVFTDHAAGFSSTAGAESIPFAVNDDARASTALATKRKIIPSFFGVRDYNYRTPHLDLTGEHELAAGFAGGVIEFGAHQKTPQEGKALAAVRAEERLAAQLVYIGQSNVPALSAGM